MAFGGSRDLLRPLRRDGWAIVKKAHVGPALCIRALQRQVNEACGTINEMRIARNEARAIVRRLANEHPSKRSALERDARDAVAKWALEEKGGAS